MISTSYSSTMLRKPSPQLCPRSGRQSVRTNPHDTRTCAAIRTLLTRFKEEVHTAPGPRHSSCAIRKDTRLSQLCFKHRENGVEPSQVEQPVTRHALSYRDVSGGVHD